MFHCDNIIHNSIFADFIDVGKWSDYFLNNGNTYEFVCQICITNLE